MVGWQIGSSFAMEEVERGEGNDKSNLSAARSLPLIFLAAEKFHRRRCNDRRGILKAYGGAVMSRATSSEGRGSPDSDSNTQPVLKEKDGPLEGHAQHDSSLDLSNGDLTLDSLYVLQHDMSKKGSLTHMSITNMALTNEAQSKDIQRLLVEIWHQQQLTIKSVNLSNCGLDDDLALQFASRIADSSCHLETLILSGNKISDVGAAALAATLNLHHCHLKELDLSNNRLSQAGVLAFCEHMDSYQHLRALRLRDSEQLLPVSVYQQFAAKMEKNLVIRTLTMGSEIMDGSVDAGTNRAEKEMDALLRYFWQEPAYTAITDHIRNLLRLNCSGLGNFLQANGEANTEVLRSILDVVEKKHETDACYRILQLKPDLVS